MKCSNCGADLKDGVLFCRECGTRVEEQKMRKRFCRECGSEYAEGEKFCQNCGASLTLFDKADQDMGKTNHSFWDDITDDETEKTFFESKEPEEERASTLEDSRGEGFESTGGNGFLDGFVNVEPEADKEEFVWDGGEEPGINSKKDAADASIKKKGAEIWNSSDLFMKISMIFAAIGLLLFLAALYQHKSSAIMLSIIQIGGAVAAGMIHLGLIKSHDNKLKYLLLVLMGLFALLNVRNLVNTGNKKLYSETDSTQETVQPSEDVSTADASPANYKIEKGTEYAYMSDEWNVYIAYAVSDSIIKIQQWDKTLSSTKKMSFSEDIGSFKINDRENGFSWIDDAHTAFTFSFSNKNNSNHKIKNGSYIFTINISDSDTCKGTDYDESIACYTYTNDDWHKYRAIPLTDTLIKIECWSRTSSLDHYLFGYDWMLIDMNNTDTDFAWTDDERTSFTLTTKDPENGFYWKENSFVVFELENEDFKYANVVDYLGIQPLAENEIRVPSDASSYQFENYADVQKSLSEAGFENISTEILYDIVLGWTDEGEVESVSINGDSEFKKGDIFKKDASVVITYHMKEEDDPNKDIEEAAAEEEAIEEDASEEEVVEEPAPEEESSGEEEEEADEESEKTNEKPVSYSTNTKDTVRNGNTGVYSYSNRGSSYQIYYIIDFDEGYVYRFTEGNADPTCDRLKIDGGDLNTAVIVTYHDGGDTWQNWLYFKYAKMPDHLILADNYDMTYDFYPTDLDDALELRNQKTIHDY